MSDLAKFAGHCRSLGPQLEQARVRGTQTAARNTAARIRQSTAAAARGGVLSGVGASGAAVGVVVQVLRNGDQLVKATGPYQLIERDTSAHVEPRRRGKKPLKIPGIGYRRYVHHPGTRGKHPFERGLNASLGQVPGVYQREVRGAITRAFR